MTRLRIWIQWTWLRTVFLDARHATRLQRPVHRPEGLGGKARAHSSGHMPEGVRRLDQQISVVASYKRPLCWSVVFRQERVPLVERLGLG